jgi:hypothetical protein
MLDPNVQKKGGFGAFAERDQERHAARAAGAAPDDGATDPPAAPGPTPPAVTPARVGPTRGRAFTPRG